MKNAGLGFITGGLVGAFFISPANFIFMIIVLVWYVNLNYIM